MSLLSSTLCPGTLHVLCCQPWMPAPSSAPPCLQVHPWVLSLRLGWLSGGTQCGAKVPLPCGSLRLVASRDRVSASPEGAGLVPEVNGRRPEEGESMWAAPASYCSAGSQPRGPDLLRRKGGVQMHGPNVCKALPHQCLPYPLDKEALVSGCPGSARCPPRSPHSPRPEGCRGGTSTVTSPAGRYHLSGISRFPTPSHPLEGLAHPCWTICPPQTSRNTSRAASDFFLEPQDQAWHDERPDKGGLLWCVSFRYDSTRDLHWVSVGSLGEGR